MGFSSWMAVLVLGEVALVKVTSLLSAGNGGPGLVGDGPNHGGDEQADNRIRHGNSNANENC
jgi:hypothetical protein